MKRRVIQIVLLMVAGAIVNVAVAWGAELMFTGPSTVVSGANWDIEEAARRYMPRKCNVAASSLDEGRERWWHRIAWISVETCDCSPRVVSMMDFSLGWPMLALNGQTWIVAGPPMQSRDVYRFDTDDTAIDCLCRTGGCSLPLHPLWPGFAINTIFYAAILWMMFAVPLALRRSRRIKHGLCPACAYDLRGSPPASQMCPECGRQVA